MRPSACRLLNTLYRFIYFKNIEVFDENGEFDETVTRRSRHNAVARVVRGVVEGNR